MMSKFGDKFKNIFTVDYEDDYDDDFYDDYEEDNAEEAEPVVKKKRERVVRDDDFESAPSPSPSRTRTTRSTSSARNSGRSTRSSKVVPMRSNSDMEVCVIKPTAYEETKDIIDTLLDGKSVVLNLEGMRLELAQRIVDSVSGGCYAIRGNLQKISGYIYLVTPSSVDITGDFADSISDRTSDYNSASYESRRSYYGE